MKVRIDWDDTSNRNKNIKVDENISDFQDKDEREKEDEKDYNSGANSFSNDTNLQIFSKPGIKGHSIKNRKKLVLLAGKNGTESVTEELIFLGKSKIKNNSSYFEIYWYILSLKQHIINFFSSCKCCNITESYVHLFIRLIRSIFLIILAFLLNLLFLNQKYYSQKFIYFNEKYKIIARTTDNITKTSGETLFPEIPLYDIWKYSFTHTFVNALISFAILLVVQFIIGVVFFSFRKYLFKKYNKSAIKDLESKTKKKYVIFFIISIVLLIIFMFIFIVFGGIYGGGFIDYCISGIVTLICLQIFPFIWSIILSLLYYFGIKGKNEYCLKVSRFFMF